MKAWVLHNIGDIRYEEVSRPEPAAGEALISVRAAGICGSDIPRIYDTGAHRMPLIPGHEFAGEVVETGEGVDDVWKGKRVGVFPLIPCGSCSQCLAGRYELCRNYDYIGSRRDGAFAEYVTAPAANLIEIPEGVSYETAAMSEPMAVAVHAIRRVLDNSNTDISIAVYGLGTIGLFVTMFLRASGYNNLYLIGNKESQRKSILSMGIAEDCYYDNSEYRNIDGADVVFECVGKTQTYADAIDMAAPMGRVMLIGNPYSDMTLPRDTYWKILRNQLTVTGTWNSSFALNGSASGNPVELNDDWHYVYNLLSAGTIDPERFITHHFELQDLKQGFEIMRNKTEEYVKIVAVF